MNISAKKYLFSFILAFLLIASLIPKNAEAEDMPYVIYETSHSEYIGSGIKYENIKKFTSQGWWNINVIRVDLTNDYAEIKGLFSDKGLSNRDTVSNMVTSSQAVAGINGDFFNYSPIPHPLGTFIENGEIISSPLERAYALPTFYLDDDNNANIDFFDRTMTLTSLESGKSINISIINKAADMNMVTLLDKNWGDKSFGNEYSNEEDGEIVEMVVVDNVVKEIRIGMEAVDIPENGYVICVRGDRKGPLLENFNIGDKVKLQLDITPNLDNIKFAIGGGSIILKDGQVTNTNINISGNQPRTGIGISRDGNELILATIDGRDNSYVGVSQEVFGQILKELGAYNAINLDGGGSTTMAIRTLDSKSAQVVNKPSDGAERKVVNGIGVFTNAPRGELSYIEIETDETDMFPNTTRKFTVKGYDENHYPVEIDESKIIYTVEGIEGEINNNKFKAFSSGKGVITAYYEGLTDSIEIRVLDEVKSLMLPISKFSLPPNSSKTIGTVYGLDNEGHKAKIYTEDINWTVLGDIGYMEKGIFFSCENTATGAIVAEIGNAINSILVAVGSDEGTIIESFEEIDKFDAISYPSFVKGSIGLSEEEAVEGNSSISIEYDFTNGEVSRAYYLRFLSEDKIGLTLEGEPNKLSFWVKGDGNGAWLRGKIVDKKGKSYYLDFERFIDFTQWKQVEAQIPSGVTYPITLERLYVVEIDNEKQYIGKILIDGLKAHYPPEFDETIAPIPTEIVDSRNVKSDKTESSLSVMIARIPEISDELDKEISQSIMDNFKSNFNGLNLSLLIGKEDENLKDIKSDNIINIGYPYISHQFENLFIIDASSIRGGLRPTNPMQWIWLKNGLAKTDKDHIILFLNTPIFGEEGFKDPLEAELLHNTLVSYYEKGKTVWVIFPGNNTDVEIKDGIRYIELNSNPINSKEDIQNINWIEFIINGNEITYQIY